MMKKINNDSFILLRGWMIEELDLKGNELIVYAVIYGFNRDGHAYQGSRQYLARWTNSTVQGVQKNLNSLVEKKLIIKKEVFTEEKSAKQKLIIMEDNLDIEQTVANVNEMIQDVMTEEEVTEPVEEPVNYNERLNFESIYNTEEPVEDNPQVLVKAYLDLDDSVLLVIDDKHNELGDLVCYSHVGQHSSCDPYYPDELEELSPKDPRVKELVEEYENLGPEKIEVFALPVGELLPVQKQYHKEIKSGD